jgi:hypothetical protein
MHRRSEKEQGNFNTLKKRFFTAFGALRNRLFLDFLVLPPPAAHRAICLDFNRLPLTDT